MKTIVICAFPGSGKTYAYTHYNGLPYKMLDSDSSEYSWVKDENGKNTKVRNPDFPQNYINHIKENLGKVDVIFVSSHKEVSTALREAGIDYVIASPLHSDTIKEAWLKRLRDRGSSEEFVNVIDEHFYEWIDDMIKEGTAEKGVSFFGMSENSYITNGVLKLLID